MADYVLSAKGTYDGSDFDRGVENSKSKLSGFMEQARTVGQNIRKSLGNAVVKAADGVTSAIGGIGAGVAAIAATGGISRALNMEKAKTMFKGLQLDWNDYSQTISDAVDGTAFSMDAAALTAAGLAAAGVSAGDQMARSLNGATGVAATFGADLSDIGGIYQKVAAQGKLSGDQLAQLSDRGINAVSILSKYLGKSQAEVRDMVTSGKIDFQTFSDAMYDAFGDSAKGANDTFTGVTSNIKANIAKIGEMFASPALGGLQRVFAALLPVIKSVRGLLEPLADSFSEWVDGKVPGMVSALDSLREKIDGFGGDLSKVPGWVKLAAAAIGVLSVGAMGGLVSQIPIVGGALGGLFGKLGALATPVGTVTKLIGGLKEGFAASAAVMGGPLTAGLAAAAVVVVALGAAFVSLMATNEGFRGTIMGLVGDIGSSLEPAFTSLAGLLPSLQYAWNSLKAVVLMLAPAFLQLVASITPLVSTIVSSVVPVVGTLIKIASDVLVMIASMVAPAISALADLISANMPQIQQIVETTMAAVQTVITTVWPYVQAIITSAMAVIQSVMETVWPVVEAAVSAALDVIQAVVDTVMAAVSGDWQGVWEGIKNIALAIWNGIVSIVSAAIGSVQQNIGSVLSAIRSLWNSVWNAIGTLLSNVWNGIRTVVSSAAGAVASSVSGMVSKVGSLLHNMASGALSAISGMWSSAKSAFSSGVSAVVSTVTGLPGRIKGIFAGAGSWLINSGMSVMRGFANGITRGVQSAVSAAKGALSRVRALFPFSPAKEGPFSGRHWVLYSGISTMKALGEGAVREAGRTAARFREAIGEVRDEFGGTGGLDLRIAPQGVPAVAYGNPAPDPEAGAVYGGDVTNIGDVTLDVSELEDVMTLKDFVGVLKRAKRSNPSRTRG